MTPLRNMVGRITDDTYLPLKLVIALVSVIVGLVVWAKTLEARVDSHVTQDEAVAAQQSISIKETRVLFERIDRRLSRIEGKLGVNPPEN